MGRKAKFSSVFDRLSRNEAQASRHINIVAHYSCDTLVDRSSKLIKIIKVSGVDFVTKSDAALDVYKNRLNSLLRSFASNFAMYFWLVRSKTIEYPGGVFDNFFAGQVNDKYRAKIADMEMFYNSIYVGIITKPLEGLVNKSVNVFQQLSRQADKEAQKIFLQKQYKDLNDVTRKVLNVLSDYQAEVLGVYEKNGIQFSKALEFIGQLINFDKQTVPVEVKDVSYYLPRKRLFFSRRAGTLEMREGDGTKKFAAVLAIKEYPSATYQGMIDSLSRLRIEYVITQSYRFYDRQVAKTKLRDQQKDLVQSRDESIKQTAEISVVFDEAASGDIGFGAHHFTLVCYADTQEKLNKNVAQIIAEFSDLDIICVREDVACECGFWAQLPANFSYIARQADISSKNMAGFASMHNYPLGKITGNHWGDAVSIFETQSGSPYYFNFHYKDVGNFLIFGTMGSGKTVLAGFLILQSMKFGGKRVIFDKDRGLEILVRAMGGVYEIFRPGIATGFNPCQLEDTPENRKFLVSLFKKMLTVTGQPLLEHDFVTIENAVAGMYRMDKSVRQLCHIASFFGAKKKGSLRAKFDQWHSDGTYSWLFDNSDDSLNLNADVVGFELGNILKDEECKTPALMYLTYCVGKNLEGQRGMIFCDEGWKALEDDYFRELLNDWSRTPRKKNNFLGLATQAAEDTVHSAVSKTLNESAACKIFFPNPTADKRIYIEEFGLTGPEYNLIKTLPDNEHYFLLSYGRGKESVVIRANLSGLDDEIAVISGRENTILLLDKIRAEVGDNPRDWLPIFHQRRKEL